MKAKRITYKSYRSFIERLKENSIEKIALKEGITSDEVYYRIYLDILSNQDFFFEKINNFNPIYHFEPKKNKEVRHDDKYFDGILINDTAGAWVDSIECKYYKLKDDKTIKNS